MENDMDKKNQLFGQQSGQTGQQGGSGNRPGESEPVNEIGQRQSGQEKKGGQFGNEEDDQNRDRERRAS